MKTLCDALLVGPILMRLCCFCTASSATAIEELHPRAIYSRAAGEMCARENITRRPWHDNIYIYKPLRARTRHMRVSDEKPLTHICHRKVSAISPQVSSKCIRRWATTTTHVRCVFCRTRAERVVPFCLFWFWQSAAMKTSNRSISGAITSN